MNVSKFLDFFIFLYTFSNWITSDGQREQFINLSIFSCNLFWPFLVLLVGCKSDGIGGILVYLEGSFLNLSWGWHPKDWKITILLFLLFHFSFQGFRRKTLECFMKNGKMCGSCAWVDVNKRLKKLQLKLWKLLFLAFKLTVVIEHITSKIFTLTSFLNNPHKW